MANGRQKAKQNEDLFLAWAVTQSDEDFRQIISNGKLSRVEIAKSVGFGKSALTQNPRIKQALLDLENSLRSRGVLPLQTEKAKSDALAPKKYDNTANKVSLESKRLSKLEAENIELKAKVNELEKKLERFGELSETIAEIGLIPR